MYNCLISLGPSIELILLERKTIRMIVGLNRDNLLTDIYKNLKPFARDIRKIDFVVMSQIVTDVDQSDVLIRKFSIGDTRAYSVISSNDINLFQKVIKKLKIAEFCIHDKLLCYATIGEGENTIVVGDYLNNQKILLMLGREGIIDYRISSSITSESLESFMKMYRTTNVVKMYNNLLDSRLDYFYTNYETLEHDVKLMISYTLVLNLIKHVSSYKNMFISFKADMDDLNRDEEVDEIRIPAPEDTTERRPSRRRVEREDDEEDFSRNKFDVTSVVPVDSEELRDIRREEKAKSKQKKKEKQPKKGRKGLTTSLTIVGIVLAGVAGYTIVTNLELPNNNAMINNQITTQQASISSASNTARYYKLFVSDQQQGGQTPNKTLVDDINSIKVDGVLSELIVRHSEVGIQLLLAKPSDIDNYKTELSKYITINTITNLGSVSVGKTTYTKFQIKGFDKNL